MNNLTLAEIERLTILAEEAAEVIQAVTKILRHGYESSHPSLPPHDIFNNRQHLVKELGDLRATLAIMIQAGDVSIKDYIQAAAAAHKLERLPQYLHEDENKVLARMVLDIHNGHG